MPATEAPWIVTGSSGFIGAHVCAALPRAVGIDRRPPARPGSPHIGVDIRELGRLREIARPGALIHLAAGAEVLTPWADVSDLLSSNVEGTYNVVEGLDPRVAVFASSSSVYGNSGSRPADPRRTPVEPLCLYAVSKLTGETILRDWARHSGRAAAIFRFGNVVGAGCRGLIPYLAGHILRYPDGATPARLRGEGRLVRDYVPVDYVVRVLTAAARAAWAPGSAAVLNLGAGRGMTNREVAEIVRETAAEMGFALRCVFDDPPGPGEAREVVLDMEETVRLLGIAPPAPAEVRASIAAAAAAELRRQETYYEPVPDRDHRGAAFS
jgi:nucleoside-diphosphate-sugar epimerase